MQVQRNPEVQRVMREVAVKNPDIRRFICSECLWDTEIKALTLKQEAQQEFDLHFCQNYRRRSSLT